MVETILPVRCRCPRRRSSSTTFYHVASLHILVAFTAAAKTPEAHAATMVVAKALAHTAVRVLDDDEFYQEV
jgi:hypothetical protein